MSASTDALRRAIAYLGAVRVRDGGDPIQPALYAYFDDAMRRYYAVAEPELLDLGVRLSTDADAYSLWCAESHAVELPSWWTPGQQFAVVLGTGSDAGHRIAFETLAGAKAGARARLSMEPRVITADLETGAEVPA
jgi:hypothetical protein